MYRHHIEKLSRTRLDDVLIDEGLLDRARIEDAQAEQEMTGKQLSQVLFDKDAIDEWELAKIVCTHYSLPFLDLTAYSLRREALQALSMEFCRQYQVCPVDLFGPTLTLAVCEMPTKEVLDEIAAATGSSPFLYVAVRRQIVEAVEIEAKRQAKSERPTTEVSLGDGGPGRRPASRSVFADATEPDPLADVALRTVSMQMNASVGNLAAPRAPAPPAAQNPAEEPARPRLSGRAAPVVPPLEPNPRPAPAAAPPSGERAVRQINQSWESIFDIGDDAVKKTRD